MNKIREFLNYFAIIFLVIIFLLGYINYSEKKEIGDYLAENHPDLIYEIESIKKDILYYKDPEELLLLCNQLDIQTKMLDEGEYSDELHEFHSESVSSSIQYIDSVHVDPYTFYMLTGDTKRMDRNLNTVHGYTVKLSLPTDVYYIGIFRDYETKELYYDTYRHLLLINDITSNHEILRGVFTLDKFL